MVIWTDNRTLDGMSSIEGKVGENVEVEKRGE
jgi:hypothetical protein